ncbi:mitochondrial ATPase, f0 complex, subunit e [Sporothrix brasiliensis 5110]|uniref:ATP synthase F(0) complex subunit e, mitochondrial n=1 Tax=Sporothrix brasiliensis 5110 TaxID=1398154 RepID=A0A0C2IKQ5_9PEZI|nr:mitochondrial ATPase, f0 complex, subunit e [Sporothrix brasiliensis 5110]KIH89661.1 mitochondrial ATPase, f0 complex, subunit e [Sporothrix brasiliensis 5110]
MASNAGVNVLRYSALGLGVLYGFYHQRTINSSDKAAAAKRAYEHKQSLINQAKAEYTKLRSPSPAASATSSGLNQDPMDPKFDLEAYFEALMKEKP